MICIAIFPDIIMIQDFIDLVIFQNNFFVINNDIVLIVTPRFLISIISANDQVKPVDSSQTLVNLGHHLENLVKNN
jgi:hypothetical protein